MLLHLPLLWLLAATYRVPNYPSHNWTAIIYFQYDPNTAISIWYPWYTDLQFRVLSTSQKTSHLYPKYTILKDFTLFKNVIFGFYFFSFLLLLPLSYPYYSLDLNLLWKLWLYIFFSASIYNSWLVWIRTLVIILLCVNIQHVLSLCLLMLISDTFFSD